MARETLTRDELCKKWHEMEKERKERERKEEEERRLRASLKEKKCKNCDHSFYNFFPATDNFPESLEICGCKFKASLVNPQGPICKEFC